MNISFEIDEYIEADIDPKAVRHAISTTIQLFGDSAIPVVDLSLTITDNETLEQLIHQYRGINAPTDVLSFQNSPDPDFPAVDPAINHYLGDIVIAYPIAKTQAEAGGHTVLDEIILLAVHGTLHLLGFDHDTLLRKKEMWAAQQQVIADLGRAHIQPTES